MKTAYAYDFARRVSFRFALLAMLFVWVATSIAEPPQLVTVLEDLNRPTDLVAWQSSGDPGQTELVIAESGMGRLLRWSPGHEAALLFDDLAPGPIRLVNSWDGPLIASHSSVLAFHNRKGKIKTNPILINWQSIGKEQAPASHPIQGHPIQGHSIKGHPVKGLAINDRYLFAICNGQLLRARRNEHRFTALRLFDTGIASEFGPPQALCFGDKGHLIVACLGDDHAQLAFCNPHESATPSIIAIEGITHVDSLGHGFAPRPAERRLYALVSESNAPGLYRLDAMPPLNGQLRCQAKLVVPIERPIAFTMAPDGSAYFLALTEDGQAVLLHSDQLF